MLAALMIVGQAGSALTAELGLQRNSEQIDALETMGIDPLGYFNQRLQGAMIAYLDVVEAQRTLLQAERATVQNLGARYGASVQLIKSLGGGWSAQAQPSPRFVSQRAQEDN